MKDIGFLKFDSTWGKGLSLDLSASVASFYLPLTSLPTLSNGYTVSLELLTGYEIISI